MRVKDFDFFRKNATSGIKRVLGNSLMESRANVPGSFSYAVLRQSLNRLYKQERQALNIIKTLA